MKHRRKTGRERTADVGVPARDCHNQCAHWFRNDKIAGACTAAGACPRPTGDIGGAFMLAADSRPYRGGQASGEDVERITEIGQLRARVQRAERKAERAMAAAQAARMAYRKEVRGLTAFVGVAGCLIAAGACLLQAAWWTAVAPLVLMLVLLSWAGWLG